MFDKEINRYHTNSIKWDMQQEYCGRDNLIPFWVADMDFEAPEIVQVALQKRLEHAVFGYSFTPNSLKNTLINWYEKRHGWTINPDSLVEIPSIVTFLYIYADFIAQKDEAVIIQEPVYYPFRKSIVDTNRTVINNQLLQNAQNEWIIDFNALEDQIKKSNSKNLIFCNPHNPVGRVWKKDELQKMAEICNEYNVNVISDEIHADLIMPNHSFNPWLKINEYNSSRSMALISPNKTFNLPGLSTAWAIIPNKDFRLEIQKILKIVHLDSGSGNPFSITAVEAAWSGGHLWLDNLINYIWENYQMLKSFMQENIPAAKITDMQGTILVWIDFRALGLSDDIIWQRLLDHGIWLSRGSQFGKSANGFWRMNIACPRNRLMRGLDGILKALQ